MGAPNFGRGRFGNPTSNYPANPFFPNGNQNNNMGRPQNQGNYPNGQYLGDYPNQQGYPYQGDSMNPNAKYPGPQYQNPNQGNFQNLPNGRNLNGGGFPNQQEFPYQGDNMNNNFPNTQFPTGPNNPSMNTGNINRPFQNGGIPNQGDRRPYPGNFNPDFRPDDLNNVNNPNAQFPGNHNQNQYNPPTGFPYQNNPGFGQPDNRPIYSSNNLNGNIPQFPNMNRPGQFNPGFVNPAIVFPGPTYNPANYTNILQNRPQRPNNQGSNFTDYPNYNNTGSTLGNPVVVGPGTATQGQASFGSSTESPTQRKCIEDCAATSEYNPICGTNNVTYVNPGNFICARNCGVVVYLQKQGRCDAVNPRPVH
ncbi:GATA zinc finger domain-containing protein 14-like isoform X2 [Trichoplusia ni]|nr:GATA zinc finger domain-containing protein 14-like isoform X2 [Trichoplusia ni]